MFSLDTYDDSNKRLKGAYCIRVSNSDNYCKAECELNHQNATESLNA